MRNASKQTSWLWCGSNIKQRKGQQAEPTIRRNVSAPLNLFSNSLFYCFCSSFSSFFFKFKFFCYLRCGIDKHLIFCVHFLCVRSPEASTIRWMVSSFDDSKGKQNVFCYGNFIIIKIGWECSSFFLIFLMCFLVGDQTNRSIRSIDRPVTFLRLLATSAFT